MTDDLVGRLRAYRPPNEWGDGVNHVICDEAAARIEALEALVEAAFKEGISTGYQCGKADEDTTDEWHAAWLASDAFATARVAQHLKQENAK